MAVVSVAAMLAAGCFKSVVTYTDYTMAIYNQTSETGPYSRARDIDSYVYYVDTTDWRVASYEDAVNRIITNKQTGEQRNVPDVLGAFNSSKEYSMSVQLKQELSMIVVVNPELKLYAYRSYELPVNLDMVTTKLYMCSWRRTYASSGWIVVNNFYVEPPVEEPEDPENPENPEDPENPDNPEDPENPDDGGGDTDTGTDTDTDTGGDTGTDPGTDINPDTDGGAAAEMR